MNSITDLLDLEDGDLCITETQIQGQTKTITIETKPVAHYCPNCGYRMYSRVSAKKFGGFRIPHKKLIMSMTKTLHFCISYQNP